MKENKSPIVYGVHTTRRMKERERDSINSEYCGHQMNFPTTVITSAAKAVKHILIFQPL